MKRIRDLWREVELFIDLATAFGAFTSLYWVWIFLTAPSMLEVNDTGIIIKGVPILLRNLQSLQHVPWRCISFCQGSSSQRTFDEIDLETFSPHSISILDVEGFNP
jgi:hypothetical protein